MGKLISCKSCSKEVSKSAKTCPHCGEQLKMGFIKKAFIGGTVFFGGIIVLAAIGSKGPHSSSGPGSTSMQAKTPIMEVNINSVLDDYKANEVGADNKYKDKWIKTSGIVGDVKKDIVGSLYVTLGTGKTLEIPQIQAFFEDENNSKLAQLKKGQKLTVVCKVDGLMMNVLGKGCMIGK